MDVSNELGFVGNPLTTIPIMGGARRKILRRNIPRRSKRNFGIIVAIIVVLVLLVIAIIVIYKYNTKPEDDPDSSPALTATFSDWSGWSGCLPACGSGTQTRTRTCTGPNTTICNAVPPALLTSTQSCNNGACVTPPTYSDWTTCSTHGMADCTQTRTCTANCVGNMELSRPCNASLCLATTATATTTSTPTTDPTVSTTSTVQPITIENLINKIWKAPNQCSGEGCTHYRFTQINGASYQVATSYNKGFTSITSRVYYDVGPYSGGVKFYNTNGVDKINIYRDVNDNYKVKMTQKSGTNNYLTTILIEPA